MPPTLDITSYKGPVGRLSHRCPLCPSHSAASPHLLRCAGCRAIRYCSREHQVSHRPQHKSACSKIKKARAKLEKEDHNVRNATEDFMTPANAFETHVGHFWGILNTRDYMRARFGLAQQLLSLGTLDGVSESLEHFRDMLRLCRSDNMGARGFMPAIMLRLDLDQECYDFIKWWETCDPDGTYDWADGTLPYLNIHGADVLENPSFLRKYSDLNFLVAVLILKLKLLVDIRNLKIARKIFARRHLPFELRDQIEQDVVRSPLSTKFQKEPYASLIKTEMKLLKHCRQIGVALVEANHNFMFDLFEPEEALCSTPDAYMHGSWEEMAFAMQHSYATWWETEGVLDLLNDARACGARDSESEIEDWMEDEKARNGRTAAELLADLSVKRIWGYLEYALENASYLGPWSERPSEQHTRRQREVWAQAKAEEGEEAEYGEELWPMMTLLVNSGGMMEDEIII
ncbi:hypothetical protein GGS26DRAFT_568528 [Hypomontagnella submonticulosa]|nr:hypothetical protein GGS26DRAFT_568528 [Hypomontagnella submonticulosa]